MQADLPHTLYKRKKKKGGKNSADDYEYNPNDPAIAKTEELIRKKKEKMAKESGFTTEELFNKEQNASRDDRPTQL